MMLLADPVDARTALEWGLINRIAPKGEALAGALALATRLEGRSATPPSSARMPAKACAPFWPRRHHSLRAGDTLSFGKTAVPWKLSSPNPYTIQIRK